MTACLAFEANVSRRPAVTTVISVGRMKHTHSYHDCTKWFKLDFTFKESTFVLGTENPTQFLWLGNLYFSEFPRSAFHLQNTMLTNYILFFLPGYKIIVPWGKKKSRHGTDRKTDIQIKLKHGFDLSVFAHVIIFWKATCFPHLCKTVFVMKEACQHEHRLVCCERRSWY